MIYLDNAATTKPSMKAIEAAERAMEITFGNPSSAHELGVAAANLLNDSRNEIYCALLGNGIRSVLPRNAALVPPIAQRYGRLIFTGSGTEANNLAILGTVHKYRNTDGNCKIITTDSEHPSVLNVFKLLAEEGFSVAYIKTTNGVLDIEQLKEELTPNVKFISLMLANNETGAVYDVKTAFTLARSISKDVVCHTDAVQAFGKTPFTAASISADMISISGHKVHALKGIGALWINENAVKKNKLTPLLQGGGQEWGHRSGTENTIGIASFSAAVNELGGAAAGEKFKKRCTELRDFMIAHLPENVVENRPTGDMLPHIVSITLPIPKSQPMLNFLSAKGIYISAGSACSSHKGTVSHALTAFGLSSEKAAATVRISIDATTTEEDILKFCDALKEGISTLYGKNK